MMPRALVSGVTRSDVRASSLAALTTGTSLARLIGSVIVGAIWSWRGPGTVVILALTATVCVLIASVIALKGAESSTLDPGTA